jgi:nucleoid-associated protein YgaU
VKLIEHRQVSAQTVTLNKGGGTSGSGGSRPVEVNPVPQTYTVVRGDSLWLIAQRFLGNGNRWRETYNLNKDVIDARNRGTGNAYHTIYSGQVFRIP